MNFLGVVRRVRASQQVAPKKISLDGLPSCSADTSQFVLQQRVIVRRMCTEPQIFSLEKKSRGASIGAACGAVRAPRKL